LNGEDGAICKDMGVILENDIHNNKYDIITNIGFTEHVSNSQYNCFKNIHNYCRVGGIMIHNVPIDYCTPSHGRYQYPEDYFTKLAVRAGYEIVKPSYVVNWVHRQQGERRINEYHVKDRDLVCAVLKKITNEPFIDKELFDTLDVVDNGSDISTPYVTFKIYEMK
jgi:hypothetical protein